MAKRFRFLVSFNWPHDVLPEPGTSLTIDSSLLDEPNLTVGVVQKVDEENRIVTIALGRFALKLLDEMMIDVNSFLEVV